ncbi:uncharacterized protein C57A7.06-like isoform X1 [Panicum miliaceum]|uniref:Uncharacterized protein C57A7.06-like isoform X1 n=1 Tax=Panicum miliaceum TaxID=4540 RepID=A0A3L6S717_PANMI|nr:uncharacterized protein C57A7.06-like isoform X1 [Panicum miliaceum]
MPKNPAMRRGKPARGPEKKRRHGPRLPTAMRRELDAMGPAPARGSDDEEVSDAGAEDVYEYEEGVPEEEAGKNGRYDAVAKYEYEFDSDASEADEDVPSEEGEDMEEDENDDGKKRKQPLELPLQHGDGPVTIHDLLDNIQGKPGYSKVRKRLQQQEKKTMVMAAPLPKVEREKLERRVTYDTSRGELTKWERKVKHNREAPTLFFENDSNLGVNTIAAIANEFKPRTEFEKRIAEITRSTEIMEAHKNDGAKILELNKIDVEDVRERQNRLAKMRSLLFRHEMKAKRVKKIKSRTYHRMLKKDKLKAASADFEADPEAAKDYAMKQEFKRAEERAMKKQEDAAYEEARQALEEYDDSLRKLEDDNTEQNEDSIKVTGKRTFGPAKNTHKNVNKRQKLEETENSDSEYDSDPAQHLGDNEATTKQDDIKLGTALLDDEQNDLYRSFDDIMKNPGPKTTFEVGMLAGDSWKTVKSSKGNDNDITNKSKLQTPSIVDLNPKQRDNNPDSDSEEEMVEGFLTISDTKESYELPSQAELIRQAFAGDDVEAEFEKDKMEVLNEENPEPEKPALVPGWGQWTDIQQKKGLPSWMIKEHEIAKRNREEALKRRKDSKLKHVIISEHVDKKVEKYLVRNLPFPYTSKDVYEQSIRMPIGPDFNPAISVSALNRPAIVKKPGVIIKPIQYEEVDPHQKPDEPKRVIQRVTPNQNAKKASSKQSKGATSHKRK